MADQVYLIPGVGLYKDTEQDKVVLIPGGGLYKEQTGSTPATFNPAWAKECNKLLSGGVENV